MGGTEEQMRLRGGQGKSPEGQEGSKGGILRGTVKPWGQEGMDEGSPGGEGAGSAQNGTGGEGRRVIFTFRCSSISPCCH